MVGRNAPCPCGSGRKYKRCCAGKNEEYLEQQVEQELDRILVGVLGEVTKQIKFEEFDSYAKNWVEELGKHWDMKSIEEAISAYYIFVARRDLWVEYLSSTLTSTLRLAVRDAVEMWQSPITLLGKVVREEGEFLEINELFGDKSYLLKKNVNMIESTNDIVFGLVLPENQTHQNGIRVVSSLMMVEDKTEDLKNAVEYFAKSNGFEQNPNFIKEHMLDIYAILLGKSVADLGVAATLETVEDSEVAATVDAVVMPVVVEELMLSNLTLIQQEAIELLKGVLAERGADLEKQEMLENICMSYFVKAQPKFRKGNVVAAGVFRAALDLDLLNEEPMTNGAVAKLFDISPASMSKHADAVRELIQQL